MEVKVLGNILWLVLGGLFMAVGYALTAILVAVLTLGIGIPFAKQLLKLAGYTAWPFGRVIVRSKASPGLSLLGNVLWLIVGLVMAVGHVLSALANVLACVFVITIPICLPFAVAHLKLARLVLWPFGREIVDKRYAGLRAEIAVR